jgi:hypothetical protein
MEQKSSRLVEATAVLIGGMEHQKPETETERLARVAALLGAEVTPQQDLEVLEHAAEIKALVRSCQ